MLIDSNILLDVITNDPAWGEWSAMTLASTADESNLVINPLIYAEVSIGFPYIEDLEEALPSDLYRREELPFTPAFLARKVFLRYRQSGGARTSPLPDFYIGAHAAVTGYQLFTTDHARYRTYFPRLSLISPGTPSQGDGLLRPVRTLMAPR